jgi:hypothetical protein
MFGHTGEKNGFLSQLDSQQLLTYDNLTVPGAYSDNVRRSHSLLLTARSFLSALRLKARGTATYNHVPAQDVLDLCVPNHHSRDQVLYSAESRSYFSTCAIQTSPLILGNDLSSMDKECMDVIGNAEIIALNQDARVSRAKLVYQWPMAEWPNANSLPGEHDDGPTAAVRDAPVNISLQAWSKPLADGSVGVVAFNRGATAASVNVTWPMIGLADGVAAGVRDLWAHAERGRHAGSYVCESIAAHDVCALKITPTKAE